MILFEWKNGKSKLKISNKNTVLKVRDHKEDIIPMKQIPVTKARETLEVMQAPSGNEDKEENYLHKKLKNWNTKTYHSSLKRQDIMKAVNMTIVRTIQYRLVSMALNFQQGDKLTRTLLKVALPKMGIVRTANNVLATAPTAYCGIGIINFYILRMIDHLKIACNHIGTKTDTGHLLLTTLEIMQQIAGIGGNPFTIKQSEVTCLEQSWWTNTLTAMEKYNVRLEGNIPELQKWTENDTFINGNRESIKFYKSINCMRLYHKICTRSDIQHTCGKI